MPKMPATRHHHDHHHNHHHHHNYPQDDWDSAAEEHKRKHELEQSLEEAEGFVLHNDEEQGQEEQDQGPIQQRRRRPSLLERDHGHESLWNRQRKDIDNGEHNIAAPASSKRAEETVVGPFLTEHLPSQYNPAVMASSTVADGFGEPASRHLTDRTGANFCYRHRPDLKCRRQVDEPGMAQLQRGLATLSHSDQQAISHVWSLFSAAPAKHRNLMLRGILAQCCFPQLSYISANVRDLIKIDFLSALPAELGFKILCYLDTTSLCKAAQVSQRWRILADDDVVWHKMCEQHIDRKCTKCGWGLPLLERKRLRTEKRQIQLRATGRARNRSSLSGTVIPEQDDAARRASVSSAEGVGAGHKRSLDDDAGADGQNNSTSSVAKRHCSRSAADDQYPESPLEHEPSASLPASLDDAGPRKRPWKDVYRDRFKVGTAWKYGRFRTRVFRGHTNGVMCVQFDDHVLISGSYDSTVKVWDVNTGEELRTLRGHTSGIRCLQFDETKLMTGSLDGTLRLWDWRRGTLLRTFAAHTGGVITLHFCGRYVASGSMDRTIRVWDSELRQTFLLRGHTDWINSVKVDEASRTLFSASDDLTVRLWDLDSRQCIKVFEGHVGQVQQVQPLPASFELDEAPGDKDDDASSVASGTAQPHDHTSRDTPTPATPPYWPDDLDRPAPPRYILTGALDSTIRLWDVHSTSSSHHHSLNSNATAVAAPAATTDHHLTPPIPIEPQDGPATRHTAQPFLMLPTDPLTNSHTPRARACVRTFFGHVEGIWALAADHLRLISGSEDRMLKVWDPRTGKCERTFTGHQGPVTCAALGDWGVASGGEDCDVRMLVFG